MSSPKAAPHTLKLTVPFPDAESAQIAAKALAVDEDLNARLIQTRVEAVDSAVTVNFHAQDLRILRIATSSFFEMLTMVLNTLQTFAPRNATDTTS
ncbi:hypothetical protein IWQ62_003697 [Dispira parvispora]|uniref:Uncharacterized protein n=1 Tax=Dispira parvispora TaxID=1520584 RepID=A0A9W8ANW1_9FUNG|nr:hypothetical protein IWQ62_003697 [Dispira parvispora]